MTKIVPGKPGSYALDNIYDSKIPKSSISSMRWPPRTQLSDLSSLTGIGAETIGKSFKNIFDSLEEFTPMNVSRLLTVELKAQITKSLLVVPHPSISHTRTAPAARTEESL